MQAQLLATTGHRARIELYTLELLPGSSHAASPHGDGTIEHVLVTRGGLEVGPSTAPVRLGPGDLASFAGDHAHSYRALADQTQAVLVLEYP